MYRFALNAALAVVLASFAAMAWIKTRDIPSGARYVGSASCAGCHSDEHAAWQGSLHNKMMRPADHPEVVVAPFDADDGPRFSVEEAVWAIGGKWEQQFMGHDGTTETLLPGAWMKLAGEWSHKGWDGWQVPVPLKRCHGCHTVGLDPVAGTFVETNIGCESCHGPSSWHADTWGLGRVYAGLESDVCGQCHTRGRDPSGEYFYPASYEPGDTLGEHFDFEEAQPGQTSSYWWGNGSERKRHQQFAAWAQGGHASSLRSLTEGYDGRYGAVTVECLDCHSAEAILAPHRVGSVADARNGITCAVCHATHGALEKERIICADCHGQGAFYHRPERNAEHVPCPAEARVACQDCHMPQTIQIGGRLALHSHRPGFVEPAEAARWGMPSGCQNGGCHEGADALWLQGHLEPVKAAVAGLRGKERE